MNIVLITILYILGIIWGLNLSRIGLIPIFLFLMMCIIGFVVKEYYFKRDICYKWMKIISWKHFVVSGLIILVGLSNVIIRKNDFLNKYEDGNITLVGEVRKVISIGDYYTKYEFKSDGDKVLLYVPKTIDIVENSVVEVQGKFEKPQGARNKGGYDYSRYLYSQGYYGSIYVYNEKNISIISQRFDLINTIRSSIHNQMARLFPKDELRNNSWYGYW